MDGMDGHAPAGVDPGDPAADTGDKLIVEAACGSGDLLHGDLLLAVAAHQNNLVIDGNIRDTGDIHHHLIHADPAQNGGLPSPDQHMELTGQAPAVAVGVAHGDGGDGGGTGGGEGAAVADFPSGRQGLHMGDPAEPGQGRLQLQQVRGDLAAGIHAIGDDAGADHFIVAAEIHQTGGVVQMPDGDMDIALLQKIAEPVEQLCLPFCPAQIGTVSRGKVAENTLGMEAGQGGDLCADVGILLRHLKTDAAHAGIHREVELGGQTDGLGGIGQGQGILPAVNGGADILHDGGGEGLDGGMAQDQNGGAQTGPTQFHGFQHGADTEKGAFALQQPGHLNGTVAIGIGLDDGHDGNTGLPADPVKVPGNGIQIDFDSGIVEIQEDQLAYT